MNCPRYTTTSSTSTLPPTTGAIIEWETSVEATGYIIQRATRTPNEPNPYYGPWTELVQVDAEVPRKRTQIYVDNTAQQNNPYCYRVRGYSSYGLSQWSEPICVNVENNSPLSPSALYTQSISDSSVRIIWKNNSHISYKIIIQRTTSLMPEADGQLAWQQAGEVTWTDPIPEISDYEDIGLAPGVTYYYQLRTIAVINGVEVASEWSDVLKATTTVEGHLTPPMTLMAQPRLIEVPNNTPKVSESEVYVSWTGGVFGPDATSERGYILQARRCAAGACVWYELGRLGAQERSFTHQNLKIGETVCYRIATFNGYWQSDFYPPDSPELEVCATTADTPVAPTDAPTNVVAFYDSVLKRVKVTWKYANIAKLNHKFLIKRERTNEYGEMSYDNFKTELLNVTGYSDDALTTGESYRYIITTVRDIKDTADGDIIGLESLPSNSVTVTNVKVRPISPYVTSTLKRFGALIQWDEPEQPSVDIKIKLWVITRILSSGHPITKVIDATFYTANRVFIDPTATTSHYYYVRAISTDNLISTEIHEAGTAEDPLEDFSYPTPTIHGTGYDTAQPDDTRLDEFGNTEKLIQNTAKLPNCVSKRRFAVYWSENEQYRPSVGVVKYRYQGSDYFAPIGFTAQTNRAVRPLSYPFKVTPEGGSALPIDEVVRHLGYRNLYGLKIEVFPSMLLLTKDVDYSVNLDTGALTLLPGGWFNDPTRAANDIAIVSFGHTNRPPFKFEVTALDINTPITPDTEYHVGMSTAPLYSVSQGFNEEFDSADARAYVRTWKSVPPCAPIHVDVDLTGAKFAYVCWADCNTCAKSSPTVDKLVM